MGEVDDIAARDRRAVAAHGPGDAAAMVDLAGGLEVTFAHRLGAAGRAGQFDGRGVGRLGDAGHEGAVFGALPAVLGVDIAGDDLFGDFARGPADGDAAGEDAGGGDGGGDGGGGVLPDDAELAGGPGGGGLAAPGDGRLDLLRSGAAVDDEVAGRAAGFAPGVPSSEDGVVDLGGGAPRSGEQAAARVAPAAREGAEYGGGVRTGAAACGVVGGPGGAVPDGDFLRHDGGQAFEAPGQLAAGANLDGEARIAAAVLAQGAVGAQRGPGRVLDAAGVVAEGEVVRPAADVVLALRDGDAHGAAQRRAGVVAQVDAAVAPGAGRAGGAPLDPYLVGGGLQVAAARDAEEGGDEVDGEAGRVGSRAALDPDAVPVGGRGAGSGDVLQFAAGDGGHGAFDEVDSRARRAELLAHAGIVVEGGVAERAVADVEVADAEGEHLVEELFAVAELGVFAGGEVGEEAVGPQHEREGRPGAGAVGAAGEAVLRLDGRRRGRRRQVRGEDRIQHEVAADEDGG